MIGFVGGTDRMIIAQLFDKPFFQVQKALSRLGKLGITHVLVSPPQKSHSSRSWWGRYQPVDFTKVEGPLGDSTALYYLCLEARRRGMTIVADTVIHHLSNESRYLTVRGNRILRAQYPRFSIKDLAGLHRPGRGRGLPILDTRSEWVRHELRNYLRYLYELGVRGFRFDSAKHIDPHLFPFLLEGLPPLLNFGELVYRTADEYPPSYWKSMKAYDFPLAWAVNRAFAWDGDLRELIEPKTLWGPLAITFVNHHDLARNRSGFANFRLRYLEDRKLAYAYLFARNHGTPMVYGPDLRYREVKAALKFHGIAQGNPACPVLAERNTIAFKRGEHALAVINKGGYSMELSVSLEPGRYRDLMTGWEGATEHGKLHWRVGGRSAALLCKCSDIGF